MSEADVPAGAFLFELFNNYSEWSDSGTTGGVPASSVKRLLQELDLLEGVPAGKTDAYVHECMLRADQDHDGVLSITEFMVWFLSEVSAMLPLKRNGVGSLACAPLYNRFVYYMLSDSGAGVRRKASGLHLSQFLRLCRDTGITSDAAMARIAAQVARNFASSDRVTGKVESGTRLQLAQFFQSLQKLADNQLVDIGVMLYRIVGDGSCPPYLHTHESNPTFHRIVLDNISQLFIDSELEQPLKHHTYQCDSCGRMHKRWMISDTSAMQAYFHMSGAPFLPQLRTVNTRNVRAVFHRYNLCHNKGRTPPSSSVDDMEGGLDQPSPKGGGASAAHPPDSTASPTARGSGDFTACCCQLRSMSLMEMQTFWKLCLDNDTISRTLRGEDSQTQNGRIRETATSLLSHKVERAFLTACSVGGVYHKDTSCGVHDKPMSAAQARQLARPNSADGAGSSAGCMGSRARAYGTPFDAASTMSPKTSGRVVTSSSAVRLSWAPPGIWTGSAKGSPSPITLARPESLPGSVAHRPPVPTLSFPQFLEALRLLAEDLIGHPQTLTAVEMALMSVLFDMIEVGCPMAPSAKHSPRRAQPRRDFEEGSPLWHFHKHAGSL